MDTTQEVVNVLGEHSVPDPAMQVDTGELGTG